MQETIIIAGGTGMIGSELTKVLVDRGHRVMILTRDVSKYKSTEFVKYANWDPAKKKIDGGIIEQATAIVNIAGAHIAEKRWTARRKKEIHDSRVNSSAFFTSLLSTVSHKVKVVVNASAIGYYGESKPGEVFSENDAPANDFLGKTSEDWENAIKPVTQLGIRLVILRTGIVMHPEDAAMKAFRMPLKFFIAPVLGDGRQMISWISLDDIARLYTEAIFNPSLNGVYNAVTPNPFSQKEFITALAKKEKGKFYLPMPVPAFALRLLKGEMANEVLKSAEVSSKKLVNTGFQYSYPDLKRLLASIH